MKTLKENHLERVDREKEKVMYSAMFFYENSPHSSRDIKTSTAIWAGGKSNIKITFGAIAAIIGVILICFSVMYFRVPVLDSINEMILKEDGVEIQLPDVESVLFDVEKFERRAMKMRDYKLEYYNEWESNPFVDREPIIIAQKDSIEVMKHHSVLIYPDSRIGGVDINVRYDEKLYTLKGIFKIVDYTEENTLLSFGQGELATFDYEYAKGKKAYFVRRWGDGIYKVYFEKNDVLFEIEISDSEKDVENVKQILMGLKNS